MKENLIVFDIDDTLTKSEFQHQFAFVDTMNHFGITNINQNWAEYEHMTDSHILKVNYNNNLKEEFDFEFVEQFEEKMNETMSRLQPVVEIEGASAFIQKIKNHPDWAYCFATGSLVKPALLKLNQAQIDANSKIVVGSNNHFSREEIVKHSFDQAKDYYNASSFKRIISIGDGIWDWQTAHNLGLHFIGIGSKNKSEFDAKNIPLHIMNWTELDLDSILLKFM